MKRALVLSGGGAKGAFQFGAIKFIYEKVKPLSPNYYFNIIAGVSVGSLNGAMLAQDKIKELEALWNSITNDKVYDGKLNTWSSLWKILLKRKSILSNKPLQNLLAEYIQLIDFKLDKYDYRFGVVSLVTGEYHSFKITDFDDAHQLQQAILASTAMPIIWEPVARVRKKNNVAYEQLIDGGVRNVSPLSDILGEDPDEITIINCNQEKFSPDISSADNILSIAKRSLTEITINEIFRSDIDGFLKINHIISQLPSGFEIKKISGKPYKKYKAIIIEPEEDMGDPLDFSPRMTQLRITHGYEIAQQAYEKMDNHNLLN